MTLTDTDISTAVTNALEYIERYGDATPWKALRATGIPDKELKGNQSLILEPENLVFAVGLSHTAMDVLDHLRPHIELKPCHLLIYMGDGDALPVGMKLVGKRPPKAGYKQPRFCPVLLTPRTDPAP